MKIASKKMNGVSDFLMTYLWVLHTVYALGSMRGMKYRTSICLDFNKELGTAPYGKTQVILKKI